MSNVIQFLKRSLLLILISVLILSGCATSSNGNNPNNKTVKIAIGYQTVTSQTWGLLIVKNQKLLEHELKASYPDTNFEIEWMDAQSGPPLTNNMIAGKLQFAIMGDMPILVNGEKGETEQNYRSIFLGFDGKGKDGKNQAVLVPLDSDIASVADLAGKEVAVPIGSSAHRMLLAELEKYGITDQVDIISQDANVGLNNIAGNKVAAFSVWEPFPSLAVFNHQGKILVDGNDTKVDYLDGVVADRNWVEQNEDYTICFLKALIQSHDFIRENPDQAAGIFAEESKYPLDITKQIIKNLFFDTAIYDKDINTLAGSKAFLQKLGNLKDVHLDKFIDDSYLRKAYEELEKEYPSAEELAGEWLTSK